jgi:CheY-like chemotaxis protein
MMGDFLFSDEPDELESEVELGTWKVLIVDDEPEVHAVTKLALSDFEFQNKRLEFLSAYSGA